MRVVKLKKVFKSESLMVFPNIIILFLLTPFSSIDFFKEKKDYFYFLHRDKTRVKVKSSRTSKTLTVFLGSLKVFLIMTMILDLK